MNWFATFLLLYALGTAAAAAVVPGREIGAYFFRFNGLVMLGFAVVACLVGRPLIHGRTPADISAAAFAASCLAMAVGGRRAALFLVPAVLGAAFAAAAAFAARPGAAGALLTAHLLSAALILGASLVAMILGHWYLANAALSFDLLLRLTRLFVAAAGIKIAISGVYIATDAERLWRMLGEHFDGILACVRIGAGLGGGLTLAVMAHSCAKIRSNQSATGLLYVAVVIVLIGELVSMYLTLERALPL